MYGDFVIKMVEHVKFVHIVKTSMAIKKSSSTILFYDSIKK